MRIIKAPDEYTPNEKEIVCFLAGGMGNTEWQEKCLNLLKSYDLEHLVIYNPHNSNISFIKEQIMWEFKYLNLYNEYDYIFSIYFDKYTKQPMSMYELGRMAVLSKSEGVDIKTSKQSMILPINRGFSFVCSVCKDAPLKEDILAQCELADVHAYIRTPEEHAKSIAIYYSDIENRRLWLERMTDGNS